MKVEKLAEYYFFSGERFGDKTQITKKTSN